MRIAVYENLPPGGALRTSYEIGRLLCSRGHEVDLYRLSTYAEKGAFDLAPLVRRVHVTPYRPLFGRLDSRLRDGHLAPRSLTLFGQLKRLHRDLASAIDGAAYDAVLVHPDAMTHSPYLLRWLSTPTVYYCQEPPRHAFEVAVRKAHRRKLGESPGPIAAIRLLDDILVLDRLVREDRENVRRPAVVAVNSIFSRERAWAAYARTTHVCYLGIDPTIFAPTGSGQRRSAEVLSVGAPIAAKNHLMVIQALSRLPGESRPVLRVVLPRPEGSGLLEQAARDAGVRLTIETGIGEADLADRYRHAIATVCASRLEPFGLTAVESMACGTAVVAIREGGFRETVSDGVTGFLVDPDPAGIAAAISRLIADPALTGRMGAAGHQATSRDWSWERTANRMEEILGLAMAP